MSGHTICLDTCRGKQLVSHGWAWKAALFELLMNILVLLFYGKHAPETFRISYIYNVSVRHLHSTDAKCSQQLFNESVDHQYKQIQLARDNHDQRWILSVNDYAV